MQRSPVQTTAAKRSDVFFVVVVVVVVLCVCVWFFGDVFNIA